MAKWARLLQGAVSDFPVGTSSFPGRNRRHVASPEPLFPKAEVPVLFDHYLEIGRLFNSNFIEEGRDGRYAYRGDLILEGDFDRPANERRPPSLLMTQVALLAHDSKLVMVLGALSHLADLETFLGVYGPDLSSDAAMIFFVRDVPTPLVLTLDGRTIQLQPNDDTLVWNDLLDLLGLEKSDLKKLSPADRVGLVAAELREFRSRGSVVDWAGALERRAEKAPMERVGAI